MLTIEEIKQAVEFADGFEIIPMRNGVVTLSFVEYGLISDSVIMGLCKAKIWLYDLFLDRIIQGMNREESLGAMLQFEDSINYTGFEFTESYHHNGTTAGIREACEKAIRFVLEGIK